MCPQSNVSPSAYSEDCLYLVVYAPSRLTAASNAPVFFWIHGGSNEHGSASDPGLDGSKFAEQTGSIVIVPQYRLGVLGFLPPSSLSQNKNLAVQDLITALKFVNGIVGGLGGDKNKVTIGGQSSGATLVRSLLASPSASGYFSKAILQSDPMVS